MHRRGRPERANVLGKRVVTKRSRKLYAAKAQAKRPATKTAPTPVGPKVHDSGKRLAAALEQQTATSEILRVISKSPTDTQPVFDLIAERAKKLCDAELAVVSRFDGKMIELAALTGDDGAKSVVAAHRDAFVRIDVDDAGALRDVDRPSDLN